MEMRKMTADELGPRRQSQLEKTSHRLIEASAIKKLKKTNIVLKSYADTHGKLPDMDAMVAVLVKEVGDVFVDIDALLTDGISFGEITAFISDIVEVAQIVLKTFSGGVKHDTVMAVFTYYDSKYDVISQLINLMPLPIPIIGRIIQRRIYRFIIGLFVKVVVKMMKITGVGAFK